MALFVIRKLILQTRMRSHRVGLDVWFFLSDPSSISIPYVCEQRRPWRDAYVISTIISWAGSNDVPTRWNSTHSMLSRLIEQTPVIHAVGNYVTVSKSATKAIRSYAYSFAEQALVERQVEVLNPFLKATETVSADKKPTLHQVVPMLLKLDKFTQNVEYDPATICKVKEKMSSELRKRRQDKDLILLGCILSPSTKCLEFLRKEEKEKANKLLLEQVRLRVQSPLAVKREKEWS